MKALLQNAITLVRQGGGLVPGVLDVDPAGIRIAGHGSSYDCAQPPALDRRTAGILYADIANYARLTEQDEDGTHLRLIESMKAIKIAVAQHNGRIANSAGDAILAEFRDADSALHCAIEVQMGSQQWNHGLDLSRQVRFRIGVNFGEVISDQGDIYGKAVNLAARLQGLAYTGGICVSDSVLSKLEDRSSCKFVSLGKQYVKNISVPVQAFWIEIDTDRIVHPGRTSAIKVSAMVS